MAVSHTLDLHIYFIRKGFPIHSLFRFTILCASSSGVAVVFSYAKDQLKVEKKVSLFSPFIFPTIDPPTKNVDLVSVLPIGGYVVCKMKRKEKGKRIEISYKEEQLGFDRSHFSCSW